MTGVTRLVAEHRLNIREGYSPFRQKKRGQAPEGSKAIQPDLQKLVEAWIMREVYYYDWLSNPVMNIEVYIDDLVVKSHTDAEMLRDVGETFRTLRKINMKLNPQKCTFWAVEGMFLGYMVTPEEIRPCPDKTTAVLQLPSPRTIKEHLSELPLLVASKPNEELIVYLYASYGAISAVLMTEIGAVQTPVYFVIRALQGPKLNYTPMEKLVLSLVFAAKRLRRCPLAASVVETQQEPWTLFTDGSLCVDGSNARLILTSPEGTEFTYALRFQFAASNNEAEYEALIAGLRIAARSFLTLWLRYVRPLQAKYVIREIHEGSCNMHAGPRKVKFLIVAIDYFTKWIEAKAVETITGSQVKQFVWDNIVYRFGLPGEIVSNKDKQFSDNPFKDLCDKLNITQWFASVKNPQSNGHVERANRSLGEGIKARLGERNKNWVEELLHVLRAHRTKIKSSHGDTPFSLTYGTEAVIPAEIEMPTYHTTAVDVIYNDEELWLNMDLLEERRKRAAICEAKSKLKMTKYYNARVRGVTFRPGDFVYRSNDASHAVNGGKLGPKWEGPYEVTEALGDGAYKLRSMDGIVLPRT
nr:reverse transcriptase domain-containing protein [Tanacetum cinerariifolium]